MTVETEIAEISLQGKRKSLYMMIRDEDRGNWVKIEEPSTRNAGAIEAAKDLQERYEHISYDTLSTLPQFPKIPNELRPRCERCEKGKAPKPFAHDQTKERQIIRTTRRLERLYTDLVGPITPITPTTQFKYIVVVVDDYSRYMVVKGLRKKSNARDVRK